MSSSSLIAEVTSDRSFFSPYRLNLEQRDECGLACVEPALLSREAAPLAARAPSSLDASSSTDLTARFIGVAMKAA